MIQVIDRTLERWLRAELPLSPDDGDIHFDRPEGGWEQDRRIPLVNLYLYSVAKSEARAAMSSRIVTTDDGGLARERNVPVVEARYLVSVWADAPATEHEILGRLVNLLVSSAEVPDTYLDPGLLGLDPRPTISMERDETTPATDLWAGLGVPPRPSAQLLVYSPMGTPVPVGVPDPPTSVQIGASRHSVPAAFVQRRPTFGRVAGPVRRLAKVTVHDSARPLDEGRAAVIEFPASPDDDDG